MARCNAVCRGAVVTDNIDVYPFPWVSGTTDSRPISFQKNPVLFGSDRQFAPNGGKSSPIFREAFKSASCSNPHDLHLNSEPFLLDFWTHPQLEHLWLVKAGLTLRIWTPESSQSLPSFPKMLVYVHRRKVLDVRTPNLRCLISSLLRVFTPFRLI